MIGPVATFHLYQRGDVWWIRREPLPHAVGRIVPEDRPCTPAERERFKLCDHARNNPSCLGCKPTGGG